MKPKLTPKEKTENLMNNFNLFDAPDELTKRYVLLCVEEIINEVINQQVPIYNYDKAINYWEEVKKEIELL